MKEKESVDYLFKLRLKGYERYMWTYTLENGKVKKIGYRLYDYASMYPSLLKNPL